jgi:dimethylargininase
MGTAMRATPPPLLTGAAVWSSAPSPAFTRLASTSLMRPAAGGTDGLGYSVNGRARSARSARADRRRLPSASRSSYKMRMRVIIRSIPESFVDALSRDPRRINVAKARRQHAAYVTALQGLTDAVTVLDADEAYPDCMFVEDQAVVHDGHAVMTWAGHPTRRGESPPVRAALAEHGLVIHDMAEPATLDGGDVLRVGKTLYVGRSQRSNAGGLVMLFEVFGPLGFSVVPVDVSGLHLKSVCSSPIDGLVLLAADTVHPGTFDGADVIVLPDAEAHASNAVGIGKTVIIPGNCPIIAAELAARGLTVIEVGTSEVRKADGALTCCSLIFE